jgi:hypothetical protein
VFLPNQLAVPGVLSCPLRCQGGGSTLQSPPRVHMDSSGLHQNITVFGNDCLWYAFRVRVRVLLRFGLELGLGLRFSRDIVCVRAGLGVRD